jgi:competence protein ComEC
VRPCPTGVREGTDSAHEAPVVAVPLSSVWESVLGATLRHLSRISMRLSRRLSFFPIILVAACADRETLLEPEDRQPAAGSSELTVRLLDVGKGDAALVTIGGSKIIIDGGPSEGRFGELLDSLDLNDTTVDAVILSHAHLDHFRGLRQLFRRDRNIRINHFIENGDPSGSSILGSIRDSANARMTRGELLYIDVDDIGSAAAPCETESPICTLLLDGGAKLHVMRPMSAGNADDRSIPVKLVGPDSASFTMWFAGDAQQAANDWYETEAGYHRSPGMQVSVLKGQNHGSCESLNDRYLQLTSPEWVLFPTGENVSGYVNTQAKELLERHGIPWYRTDRNGTVTIHSPGTVGGGYTITPNHGQPNMEGPSDGPSTSKWCA